MRKTARSWNSTLRPGRGLVRKTRLRATGGATRQAAAPRPRRPDRRRLGIPAVKLAAWRKSQADAVHSRSRYCELSGHMGAGTYHAVHVHHTFLRLDEPWASSQLVGLHLCLECHDLAHSGAGFRDRLRVIALHRLIAYLGKRIPGIQAEATTMIRDRTPRAVFRWLIEKASAAGVSPPGWQEK